MYISSAVFVVALERTQMSETKNGNGHRKYPKDTQNSLGYPFPRDTPTSAVLQQSPV
jgi:hypothetical protein